MFPLRLGHVLRVEVARLLGRRRSQRSRGYSKKKNAFTHHTLSIRPEISRASLNRE
jgi:hypothetical protein